MSCRMWCWPKECFSFYVRGVSRVITPLLSSTWFTPLVHRMPFTGSGDSASSLKVIRVSLLRSGGVMERPGEAEGVATGVGLRLLRRMDWGVKAENTGPEAAKARARWENQNMKSVRNKIPKCSRNTNKNSLLVYPPWPPVVFAANWVQGPCWCSLEKPRSWEVWEGWEEGEGSDTRGEPPSQSAWVTLKTRKGMHPLLQDVVLTKLWCAYV